MSGFVAQSIADAPIDRWVDDLARKGATVVPDLRRARSSVNRVNRNVLVFLARDEDRMAELDAAA